MFSIVMLHHYAECCYFEGHYSDCHYAECRSDISEYSPRWIITNYLQNFLRSSLELYSQLKELSQFLSLFYSSKVKNSSLIVILKVSFT
jgi:hypothetical protein